MSGTIDSKTLPPVKKSFVEGLKLFLRPSVITMLALGFSAGIPILLIFSSLSLWLREAGVSRESVTFFSWAALGYSFKFTWAPLIDRMPLPFLTKAMGRRRSWMLFSQILIVLSILAMAFIDPSQAGDSLVLMALAAVALGFSSATQDVAIDAYRIESDTVEVQATLSATYIAGYRLGMIVAGAGALFLASHFGSAEGVYSYEAWKWTYMIMAAAMSIGIFTSLVAKEPVASKELSSEFATNSYVRFFGFFLIMASVFVLSFFLVSKYEVLAQLSLQTNLGSVLGGFVEETLRLAFAIAATYLVARAVLKTALVDGKMVTAIYIDPIRDFFRRYGTSLSILLLALIGLYRISDIVLGVISNVFYQDMGFSKNEIASVVKTFGLIMSLVGGFLGGILAVRMKVIHIMMLGAILSAGTNLLFLLLSQSGNDLTMLYVVISADNIAAGLASAGFVAFLSSLTNVKFTAVQYAVFTSLMTLLPKIIGGYSGTMVSKLEYSGFFIATTLMGIPVLLVIWLVGKRLK
jgi:PAT family beta-lactamase induction signal transducer AmpG